MQTIEHLPDGTIFFKPHVSLDEMLYLTGATKPHYPVPARYNVRFQSWAWQMHWLLCELDIYPDIDWSADVFDE